jgi:UDP-N-acetyl-D-mannosaminuronic acid transferase (WecB/TagA/CpsF family)
MVRIKGFDPDTSIAGAKGGNASSAASKFAAKYNMLQFVTSHHLVLRSAIPKTIVPKVERAEEIKQ